MSIARSIINRTYYTSRAIWHIIAFTAEVHPCDLIASRRKLHARGRIDRMLDHIPWKKSEEHSSRESGLSDSPVMRSN